MCRTTAAIHLCKKTNYFPRLSWEHLHGIWKSQKKISFNIASEASYVYILSGQKLTKNGQFWQNFWKPEAFGQTVLPDRSVLKGQKVVENVKIVKFKCDILSNFQTLVLLKVVGSNYDHAMANILLKKLKIIC